MRTLSKARTLAAPQRRSFIDWMTNYPDKVCTKGCCCVLCVVLRIPHEGLLLLLLLLLIMSISISIDLTLDSDLACTISRTALYFPLITELFPRLLLRIGIGTTSPLDFTPMLPHE
jgi:hypothetical protein